MSHRMPLVTVLLIAALPSVASAQPTGVFAKRVLVRSVFPDIESKNRLVVVAKDATITFPTPGAFQDPRCANGASGLTSAEVIAVGLTAELLCDDWTLIGSETSPKGYRYADPELDQSAVRSIVWKAGANQDGAQGQRSHGPPPRADPGDAATHPARGDPPRAHGQLRLLRLLRSVRRQRRQRREDVPREGG